MARRRRDFTDRVLVILTVLVLLAAFAVVLVAVYPEAVRDIVAPVSNPYGYP